MIRPPPSSTLFPYPPLFRSGPPATIPAPPLGATAVIAPPVNVIPPAVTITADNPIMQTRSEQGDRKSTRLNSSHLVISYAVFCLKKKKTHKHTHVFITDTVL